MAFASVLFFDKETEAVIVKLWQRLADSGIVSMNSIPDARPHITLAISQELSAGGYKERIQSLAVKTSAFPIYFTSYGFFGGDAPVLFVAPTMNPRLLGIHERFHEAFEDHQEFQWKMYLPERWVPHITLVPSIPIKDMAKAAEICLATTLPFRGMIREIGMVAMDPIKYLFSFELS